VQSWEGSRGLVELNLAGCRGIADSGVAALSVLTGLRLLNLSSNKNITSWCEGGGGPTAGLMPGGDCCAHLSATCCTDNTQSVMILEDQPLPGFNPTWAF